MNRDPEADWTRSRRDPPEVAGRSKIDAVPVRHPGRWIAIAIALVFAIALAISVVTNDRFQWDVVGEYLFSAPIMEGVRLTLILTVVAEALGIVVGVALAVMRLSPNPILSRGAWIYVWFFRGTPLLVQLIFWYNLSALYPTLSFGIPFGPTLISGNANDLITPFAVAILGLGLNEGAYTAEIVRGGIAGIDRGQSEAAKALGITHMQTLRRIVLPQAMKLIVPPLGNQTILMLKTTSLVSILALADLLYAAQAIYARTFQTMPLLIVVSLWYLAITSVLTVGQHYLELHFSKGTGHGNEIGLWQRWRHDVTNVRANRTSSAEDGSTNGVVDHV
jgi:polar amino acid transport system permease protein